MNRRPLRQLFEYLEARSLLKRHSRRPIIGSGGRVVCRSTRLLAVEAGLGPTVRTRAYLGSGGAAFLGESGVSRGEKAGRSRFGEPELFLDTSGRRRLVVEVEVSEDLLDRARLGDGGDDAESAGFAGRTF